MSLPVLAGFFIKGCTPALAVHRFAREQRARQPLLTVFPLNIGAITTHCPLYRRLVHILQCLCAGIVQLKFFLRRGLVSDVTQGQSN